MAVDQVGGGIGTASAETQDVPEWRIKIISSRYSDLWFDRMVKFPEREEFRGIWDRV